MSNKPLLAHAIVAGEGAAPTRYMFVLHGILGSGSNWRTFARRLVKDRPSWGLVLVDLRLHGASVGFLPPHTVAACAQDLSELAKTLDHPVTAIFGHSFGGKVALEYARTRPELDFVWVLDSSPGARPDARGSESTLRIVEMLDTVPQRFPSREAFIDYVVAHGTDRPLAMWLAMNCRPMPDGGYGLRIDLLAMHALLDDYFACDEWPVIAASSHTQFHLVIGGRSSVLGPEERTYAQRLEAEHENVHVHTIPTAGHWVHVDAPEELYAIVLSAMP